MKRIETIQKKIQMRYKYKIKSIKNIQLPYVVGYGGYRIGVKPRNYFSENFEQSSLKARKEINQNN